MKIAIAPSYGNRAARQHWADTLDQKVDFAARGSLLSGPQREALDRLHPSGHAHFWGAVSTQDRNVARLDEGDFVLFTGQNMIRGIGEVGVRFQNAEFADTMWAPDADRGSWRNVYSLQSFTPVEIKYDVLRTALNSSPLDNFMGMRIVEDPERVAAVVEAFGLASESEFSQSVREAQDLLTDLGSSEIVPPEANNVSDSSYTRTKAEITFSRAESALVDAYSKQLPEGVDVGRLRIEGRLTDLYVRHGSDAELIEAKSGATNGFVRQALAQSLDYATSSTEPVTRLSALFPSRPADRDVKLLHRFGIDCISRTSAGSFDREPAPERARTAWQDADLRTEREAPKAGQDAAVTPVEERRGRPIEVTVYSQPNCVGCAATERALKKADVAYELIDLSERPDLVEAFRGQGLTRAPIVETTTGERWSGYNPGKLRESGLDHRSRQQRRSAPATGEAPER